MLKVMPLTWLLRSLHVDLFKADIKFLSWYGYANSCGIALRRHNKSLPLWLRIPGQSFLCYCQLFVRRKVASVGMELRHDSLRGHRLGGDGRSDVVGTCALLLVWGGALFGSMTPVITIVLAYISGHRWALGFLGLALSTLFAPLRSSPAFNRFYLRAASCVGGATLWFDDAVIPSLGGDAYMICYHPHGVLPLALSFNGGLRLKAGGRPGEFIFADVKLPTDCNAVLAPALWRVPFLCMVLQLWGACTPASKKDMKELFSTRKPFGMFPGGSEEVAIHEHGRENVFINERYGFIKYGLEFGYKIVVAFTYGETDQYRSLDLLRPLNLWLVKRFGFVLPIFWGRSLACPVLPNGGGVNTVFGEVIDLPQIKAPTTEDVLKWHGVYVTALERVFERHRQRFGFKDRSLRRF